ncbi:hypothetical protein A9G43_00830 [Gilliamella sp. Occ3-1]|jgi:hypothetical protein|uniref:hypothetical protein n=1 Tax=Gilliamella sp. Occ3-1 TaxID=3120253 RepID=UPI00080E7595|nr:hypothetical protein [Gilliamella apicola]OCG69496.1 hypothetical protein A9G43_00830 [Gilliamella apicola]
MKLYNDILEKAIDPTHSQEIDLWETDHGYLDDNTFEELARRRLEEKFKHESYVRKLDNGETWQFNPDGTKFMIRNSKGERIDN